MFAMFQYSSVISSLLPPLPMSPCHKLLHLPVIKLLPAIQSSEAKTLLMNVMLSEKNGQNVTRTIFVKLLLIICFKLPI